ncbi:unnamed protein product [Cuscuta europaea]|uniref:Uncharacterized protein n=1 Tax=Cuscuta europaea TaxID=41803 RepID=A0A9P1E6R2_CUSEU|nr:unnamed protein product [Cuscuta europaea]
MAVLNEQIQRFSSSQSKFSSSRSSSQSSKSRTSSQLQSTSSQVSVLRAQGPTSLSSQFSSQVLSQNTSHCAQVSSVPQEFVSGRQSYSTDRSVSRSRENGEKFTEGNNESQKKSPAESLTSQASQLSLKVINLQQPSSDAKSASQFGENAMSASQFEENAKKFTEGDNENEEKLSVVAGPEIGPTAVHVSLGCPASDASKGSMEFSNKVFGRVLPVTSQNVNNSNASQGPGQNLHHIIENRLQPNTEGAGVQNMRLFGGIITVPIVCDMKSNELCSFFILTNPRELQFYENICCSTKKPEQENNHYVLQSYSIPLSEENLVKPGCGQLCSKGVMKGQVMKIMVQKFEMYWEGRGARMKMKSEVKAVSYHPP